MSDEKRSPKGTGGRPPEESLGDGVAKASRSGRAASSGFAPRGTRRRTARTSKRPAAQAGDFTGEERLLILDCWMRSKLAATEFSPLVGVSGASHLASASAEPIIYRLANGRKSHAGSPRGNPVGPSPADSGEARRPSHERSCAVAGEDLIGLQLRTAKLGSEPGGRNRTRSKPMRSCVAPSLRSSRFNGLQSRSPVGCVGNPGAPPSSSGSPASSAPEAGCPASRACDPATPQDPLPRTDAATRTASPSNCLRCE